METDVELADFFKVNKQAVSKWGNKEIPIRRQLELRISHPSLFKSKAPKIRANRSR